jgi:5-methylcytosine-specific restriction endonuclease McrA
LERDHHICFYCGAAGDTIDHLVPNARGGLSTPANSVCACQKCNMLKGGMDLYKFYSHITQNPEKRKCYTLTADLL